MTSQDLTFSAQCDRQQVAVEVSSQRTIEWIVTGGELARGVDRSPLNLALALDRSGSMRGKKLQFVQQAACHVLELLDERDRVALVAYDDHVTLLAGSACVTEQSRRELQDHIRALRPGGRTDLAAGWLEGCREVAAHEIAGGGNRALLLTDGRANRGSTDPDELARHARELRRRGVSTSTFGVGLDFNEHLLESLATEGGGHFSYIERPEQVPEVFARELGELLTVVAREAFLTVEAPRGVAIEVFGDLPHEHDGGRLRIFLGDFCAGERRALYTRVLTPPDAPGTSVVLRAQLSYAAHDGQTTTLQTELAFSYFREAEVRLTPLYESLLRRAGEVEMATAAARALKLERQGELDQAQALLSHALLVSGPSMSTATATTYTNLAGQLRQGLTEEQRKRTHFAAYQVRLPRQ